MVKTVVAVAAALFASAQGTLFAKKTKYATSGCSGDAFHESYDSLDACMASRSETEDGNVTWSAMKNTCVDGVYTELIYADSETCSGTASTTLTIDTANCEVDGDHYKKVSCPDATNPDQSQDSYTSYIDASCNTLSFGPSPLFADPCSKKGSASEAQSEAIIKANGKLTVTRYNSSDCTGTVVGNITEYTCDTCMANPRGGNDYMIVSAFGCGGAGTADSAWAHAPGGLIAGWVLATVVRAMAV